MTLSESQWHPVGQCALCGAVRYEMEGRYRWRPEWAECRHEIKEEDDASEMVPMP